MPAPPRFLPRFFRRRNSTQHPDSHPVSPLSSADDRTNIAADPEPLSSRTRSVAGLSHTLSSPPSSPPKALGKPPACDHGLEPNSHTLLPDADDLAASQSSPSAGPESPSTDSAVRLSFDQKLPDTHTEEVDVEANDEVGPLPVLTLERPTPEALGEHLLHKPSIDLPYNIAPEARIPDLDLPSPVQPPDTLDLPSELTPSSTEPIDESATESIPIKSADAEIKDTPIHTPDQQPGSPNGTKVAVSPTGASHSYFPAEPQNNVKMPHRKVWVKRPGASATLVQIQEGDLVDDVREMILKKYANSLGRTFDAPDMTLRIIQRGDHGGPRSERLLGPEEDICRTIDAYYNGKQQVEEALIIDTPAKKTPRPSPHFYQPQSYHTVDDYRPLENGTDYFPPMPAIIPATIPQTSSSHESRSSHHLLAAEQHGRSIAVLNTGQLPPLPSPGGRRRTGHRPHMQRTHTASPTIVPHPAISTGGFPLNPVHLTNRRPRLDSAASDHHPSAAPAAPPLPTPPAPEAAPTTKSISTPPTPNGATSTYPGHRSARGKKPRRLTPDGKMSARSRHQPNDSLASNPSITSTMLDGSVPPINVLIVEDNIINLRILQGLMKRLKVRWDTAMNGQIAVDKWKTGGFHLVLMDIQMPIMNGLEATKAIRQLERENGIGVFSSAESTPMESNGKDDDAAKSNGKVKSERLPMSEGFFKSPIIIVALTASSLQSDRHEALAAGCNDFLTKPVDFMWLQRKVKEWGCMQALIDFDGWRRWKDYANREEANKTEEERAEEREKDEKARIKMEKMAKLQEKQKAKREEDERRKRASLEAAPSPAGAGATTSPSSSKATPEVNAETDNSDTAKDDKDTKTPSPTPIVAINGKEAS